LQPAFLFLLFLPSLQAANLDAILKHVDLAGTHFAAMSAQFTYVQHTDIAPDHDLTSTG
jgi:hypothetical protein